jgi:polysaccharide export outer membrane protein
MTSLFKKLVSSVFLLTLSGCTIVPGGHVDVGLITFEESFDINPQVNVRVITPDLLNEIRQPPTIAQTNIDLENEISSYQYIIGKGDILTITVWDHPELTTPAGQYRSAGESGNVVHSDGTIFYPYIGKVNVVNKSVDEVRGLVTELLGKFIKQPQIDVSVAAYRSQRTFVTGEVKVPSVIPITNVPLTLLDALNQSGGMDANADWRSVVLTTNTNNGAVEENLDLYALYQKGDMSQNRLLSHNDIIHVPRNDTLKVFVMGDVVSPTTQSIDRSGLTLAEALNDAGGLNQRSANASGIFVLRASEVDGKLVDVFHLNASVGPMFVLSTQFDLKPLDIVYVTSAPAARWNRLISQLLPTFSSLRYSAQIDSSLDN